MHKLKKYPNRRLYDMTDSRYVTIEDVRALIAAGDSIQVEDSKDGSDITRSVLLQILAEQEAKGTGTVLTNRVIEHMIRFYGDQLGGVAARYIEQSMVAFLQHQEQMQSHFKQLNELNPLNMMRQAFEQTQQTWGFRPPGTTAERGNANPADDQEPDSKQR